MKSTQSLTKPYEKIFPDFVAISAVITPPPLSLYPEEKKIVRRASAQRILEFAAGRHCARRALQCLGSTAVPLLTGTDGEPLWPKGFTGSISHTEGFFVAAACRIINASSIGIDAERIEGGNVAIDPLFFTDKERSSINIHGETDLLLMLSAKESFFKAYYPQTKAHLDLDDVEIEIDSATKTFMCCLLNPSAPTLRGSRKFLGRYWEDKRFVYTGIVVKK